jgi:hypothetical protein
MLLLSPLTVAFSCWTSSSCTAKLQPFQFPSRWCSFTDVMATLPPLLYVALQSGLRKYRCRPVRMSVMICSCDFSFPSGLALTPIPTMPSSISPSEEGGHHYRVLSKPRGTIHTPRNEPKTQFFESLNEVILAVVIYLLAYLTRLAA